MTNADRTTLILAISLSLFLWVYVRLAHETPEIHRVIRGVPVQMEGHIASGFACNLHDEDEAIDVSVKGPAERINNLSREDVTVRVNISRVSSPKAMIKPRVRLPKGVSLADAPKPVTVITYPLKQETLPVTVAFIAQPPPGTTVGEYQVQPTSVTIEGRQEDLAQVKYVTVRVDPNQPLTSMRNVVPRAVDGNGEQVENVHILNTSAIKVRMASLTGEQTTRQVAVGQPELKNLPRGYTVRVVRIRPNQVTLSGLAPLLDHVQGFVETDPIDVSKMRRDTTSTVRLRVPRGLSAVEGPTVRVDLEVQPIQ